MLSFLSLAVVAIAAASSFATPTENTRRQAVGTTFTGGEYVLFLVVSTESQLIILAGQPSTFRTVLPVLVVRSTLIALSSSLSVSRHSRSPSDLNDR